MDAAVETQVEQVLAELLLLEQEVKIKSKRIDEIRKWCKEQGSFSTMNYVCVVKPRTRVGLAGLEVVAAAIGQDILEQFNLIKQSTFYMVTVSPTTLASIERAVYAKN